MGLSRRAYAKRRGCSDKTVRNAIEDGRIKDALLPDDTIDPEKADALWDANSSRSPEETESGSSAGNGKGVTDLTRVRIGKLKLDSQKAELTIGQMRGELVDRETALRAVFAFFRRQRDQLEAWPARVAPLMAAELGVDQGIMLRILEEYVDEHLRELSKSEPGLE